jgi:N4-gp56 family major capsid protein
MAVTAFGTNDAQTVKLWSSLTFREALKATLFSRFLGNDKRSIIQRLTDLEKHAGDQIKFDLLMQMSGAGVTGDNRMRDNEEALVYYQETVNIDQLRNAHAFRRMSQQRTLHNMREDAKGNLADWFAGKYDQYMFDHLCGNTTNTFANTPNAPDSTHYILSGDVARTGTIATDEGNLGTNDQITLADLDYLKEAAKTLAVPIRPAMVEGREYYVMVMHNYSWTDLKLDIGNSAYVDWPTIQLQAQKRGDANPLFTGAMGVYNGIILFESSRIYSPRSNVRRNVFLGAQAGVFASGGAYDSMESQRVGKDNLMSWYEETDDYGNEKGIAVGSIFGMVAPRFNSLDFGKIVLTSYSASHQA